MARLEVIDQRDGVQNGFALFHVDYEKQIALEVSKSELKMYRQEIKNIYSEGDRRPNKDLTDN